MHATHPSIVLALFTTLASLMLFATACSDSSEEEDDPQIDWRVDGTSTNSNTSPSTTGTSGSTTEPDVGNDTDTDTPDVCSCGEGERCDENGACVPDVDCFENDDCEGTLVCREGRCEPECVTDAQCEGDLRCVMSQCIEPECAEDTECPNPLGQTCDDGFCEENPCNVQVFTFDPAGRQDITSIHVAGSFNGWPTTRAEGGYAMEQNPATGIWSVKQNIPNGNYQYKLVINDNQEWITDPANPNDVDDGFGGRNSTLSIACTDVAGACGDVDTFDWRDAVMYFLLVDRFHDSDGIADQVNGATGGNASNGPSGQYEGGDLRGVTEKLPYLRDLGVTALWLSAPYENRDAAGDAIDPNQDPNVYSAYHGYWPSPDNIDYSNPLQPSPRPRVESKIGSEQDLRDLIDSAHSIEAVDGNNMKVLFDYVMNHVDVDSGLYLNHPDWFARRDNNFALCGPENLWDDPYWGTRCAFTDYLPPFDFDNAQARRWSIDDAMWWAREFNLDGYRLDAIKHVSLSWLTDLRQRLNEELEDPAGGRFYLVGETFAYDNAELIRSFIEPDTMLDGQFDFPHKARLCEAVFTPDGSFQNLSDWMDNNDLFYPQGTVMTTWIGNHDIPRAIHFASRQIGNCREGSNPSNGWTNQYQQPTDAAPYERLGVSFAVLLTNPGIPLIYYGDEIGLAGGGDPDNRRTMPWEDSALNPHQRALRNNVSLLSRLRAQNKVLSRGQRRTLSVSQDTWVYAMIGCGSDSPDVTIAVNRADSERTVNIPTGAYTNLITNQASTGGTVTVPPRSFVLWRAAGDDE